MQYQLVHRCSGLRGRRLDVKSGCPWCRWLCWKLHVLHWHDARRPATYEVSADWCWCVCFCAFARNITVISVTHGAARTHEQWLLAGRGRVVHAILLRLFLR
jgi:hypothetical protein